MTHCEQRTMPDPLSIDPSVLEELLESQERLSSALKAGNVGTWEWDIINRTLSWSEVTETLHGLKPGEFRGTQEHFISLMMPEDVEPCLQAIRATIAAGGTSTHEYRVRMPDGSIRWLEGQGRVVMDSAGFRIRLVGTITDITDRKDREKADRELRSANRRLQSHLENTPLAVIEWDNSGRITHWAASAEQMFGWTEAQVVGKTSGELGIVHEDDRALVASITIDGVQRSGSKTPIKNRNYTSDGRELECEWYNSVLTDEMGTPSGLLSLVHDVTDRNRIERQFIESQKMEVLGRLAGGIAHDYNNLLAVILGYAEILHENIEDFTPDSSPELLLQPVQSITSAATRAAELTRQLLAFARKQVVMPQVINPTEIIERLTQMVSPLLGANIECVTALNENAGNVKIDAGQLEQVLMNLSVNARDAMPDGGTITITLDSAVITQKVKSGTSELQPGEYVVIGVADTGTGMTPEIKQKVFEPFFTTKAVGKGTGLGLATSFGIVKQAGGEITIESEPAEGTTFRIFLPRVATETVSETSQQFAKQILGTETILLVDDDAAVRKLHAGVLSRSGYTVLEAENGIQSLKLLAERQGSVDLMVTDAIMPQISGRELADRAHNLYPNLPIIIASGFSESSPADTAGSPVCAFLSKPFSSRKLLETVRNVLDSQKPTN
jgi:two-component system, cell cycle sensor histidine kinase and response regulator CckA